MIPGALPTPDAFEPLADDSGLPDWLTGCDLDPSGGSDLLLARALSFPVLQPGELAAPGIGAPPPPEPPVPTATVAPSATRAVVPAAPALAQETDGWTILQQDVMHDPTDPPDSLRFKITLRNHSQVERYECQCEFGLPRGLKGVRASSSPRRTTAGLEWNLGTLAPGANASLVVRLPVTQATARFRSEPAVVRVATRPVPVPSLVVTCDHAPVVAAGQRVPVRVTIANNSALASARLRIEAFQHPQSAPAVRTNAAPVPPGGEHTTELLLPPSLPGPTSCRIVVTSDGFRPTEATTKYTTAAAELALELVVPESVETDDEVVCRLRVTNRGAVLASRVLASLDVPDELVFRAATHAGTLSMDGNRVEWDAFDLPAEGQWETSVRLAGFAPGRIRLRARASVAETLEVATEAPLICAVRHTVGGSSLSELLAGLALGAPDENERGDAKTGDVGQRHLMFRVAGCRFAALLGDVREVLRPLPVTSVPGTPAWMAGVANVRGDIVPVIDLAGFLELSAPDAPRGLVILSPTGEDLLGLLVDDVAGIRPLAVSADALPVDDRVVRFLTGVTLDATGVIHRLDSMKLLSATEIGSAATV